jgi:hypothetical protein
MANPRLKKAVKNSLIALLIILVFIQFIHPKKNINTAISPKDINVMYPLPADVKVVLQKACYDCHSDNTRYPWYNNMEPVAFWLNNHVSEGKRHLNFSEFGDMPVAKQVKRLKGSAREVADGGMPLSSYLWIHKDAILSDSEKNLIISWANGLAQRIAMQVPAAK